MGSNVLYVILSTHVFINGIGHALGFVVRYGQVFAGGLMFEDIMCLKCLNCAQLIVSSCTNCFI